MESFQNWLRSFRKRKTVEESEFEKEPVFAGKSGSKIA
jgi:hypothetical protein